MDQTQRTHASGSVLADRFELTAPLGEGGTGVVYRARDRTLDTEIAVKILDPRLARDERQIQRFRNEVRLARLVTHPNACRTYELVEDGGTLFITMEYVPGPSLAERMAAARPMPIATARAALVDVARGLAAAHAAGVIHRDLKPSNVRFRADDSAVVLDFGIARHGEMSGLTGEGLVVGTLAYMAPEQLESGYADARSDVYALGLLAYELLTDRLPHVTATPFGTALRRTREDPEPVGRLRPDVPAELERFVEACLRRDPMLRPADAGAALALLEADVPAAAPPPRGPTTRVETPHARVREARRARRWWIAAGLVAVVAAVAVGVVVAARGGRTAPPQAPLAVVIAPFQGVDLPPEEAWLATVIPAAVSDELADAWMIDARVVSAREAPDPRVALVTGIVRRDAAGQLVVDATTVFHGRRSSHRAIGGSPTQLAERLAAELVEARVPPPARAPSPATLAAVGTRSPEAWRLWRRARRALRMGDEGRGRDLARAAVAEDPRFALAHMEIAASLDPDDDEAQHEIDEAVRLGAALDERWRLEIEVYRAYLRGEPFVEAATRVARVADDDPYVQLGYALVLFEKERVEEAVAWLEAATRRFPRDPAAFKALARFYIGHFGSTVSSRPRSVARGRDFAERAVALAPADGEARAILAIARGYGGDLDGALAEAELAERVAPGGATARALFVVRIMRDEPEQALSAAGRLTLLGPVERAQGHFLVGLVRLYRGGFHDGLDRLCRAASETEKLGLVTSAADYHLSCAWYALQLDPPRLDQALSELAATERAVGSIWGAEGDGALFREVVAQRRRDPPDGARLAALAEEIGARAGAPHDADEPTAVRLHYEMLAAHEGRRWPAVVRAYRMLASTETTEVWAIYAAADALERLGRTHEALELYTEVAGSRFGWQEPVLSGLALERLGALRERHGDPGGAADAYGELVRRWERADDEPAALARARARLRLLRAKLPPPAP